MTSPLTPLLQTTDVERLLGETLTDAQQGQVEMLIDLASEKLRSPRVRAVIGDIDQRLATGDIRQGLIRGILLTVVCRAFDALQVGLRVRSQQYPEISTTYADSVDELVYFTDSELDQLAPEYGDGGTAQAFTIRIA